MRAELYLLEIHSMYLTLWIKYGTLWASNTQQPSISTASKEAGQWGSPCLWMDLKLSSHLDNMQRKRSTCSCCWLEHFHNNSTTAQQTHPTHIPWHAKRREKHALVQIELVLAKMLATHPSSFFYIYIHIHILMQLQSKKCYKHNIWCTFIKVVALTEKN
jgi:hypothetical protein